MKVSVIQTDLYWEDIKANLAHFEKKILDCTDTDVIVLPEMFTTGFTLSVESLGESMDGLTMKWMKRLAAEKDVLIIGSVIIKESDDYYNRCLCVFPNGSCEYYDKKHLFSYGNEDKSFTPGSESIVITYKEWRIKPLICYDLRFPIWSRNNDQYDILIYMASWPDKRMNAWSQLLIARAIENQSYVIGANRIGSDEMKLNYSGNSAIIDFHGTILESSEEDIILTKELNKEKLVNYRKDLPFLKDMDTFTLSN